MNSLHVYDVSAGASSLETGYKFYLKTKQKFAEGGFNLRKLRSNSRELEQIVIKKLQKHVSNENYILELQWDKFDVKILFDILKICEK